MATFTITELAREFDVTPRAIRFYEDQGLLAPTRAGAGARQRVYTQRDRTRLKLTLRGKRLGLSLSEVRDLVDMYESPSDTVPQLERFLQVLAGHRATLERQLEDLQVTLDEIAAHEARCRALLERAPRGTAATRARTASAVRASVPDRADGSPARRRGRPTD
ncbi:MAG: MerR family DNA-binding transcriptional regulator [Burkholderiaceae bacterium]|jgi:DNA-binding transcriptional MerR regulator|nr:MerR family DNA-binding transcriptional regulator [Burkholderiales bacterium]MCZ8097078.1 MerR family DNA-binding transcriptional regulator [Burkholderiales bacterium]MCZ8338242.1 MerR family DNA-binding transcriptional regulator [Burkholderiaceae bacterium]